MEHQETAFTEKGLQRLAEIVKAARGNRSLKAFERDTGVSYMAIDRIEKGLVKTPKITTLQKIAPFTSFSWEELLAIGTEQTGGGKKEILTADDLMPYVAQLSLSEIGRLIQKLGEIVALKTSSP